MLAAYEGEGHCVGEARRANAVDFWGRVLDWFDRYLGVSGEQ
jgi:dipeptidyl aminopeptidase/acylaminoacyl peptidase